MRSILYIILFLLITGCSSHYVKQNVSVDTSKNAVTTDNTDTIKRVKHTHIAITPYSLNEDYIVIDTGNYTNGPMEGLYAIVKKDGQIDTIDLGVGMQKISEHTYLYQLLHAGVPEEPGEVLLNQGDYIVNSNNKAVKMSNIVKHFDNYFSSPQAIDGKIYFWQLIPKDKNGTMRVYATQFDPLTNQTKTHYLLDDALDTDDSGHYTAPHKNQKGDSILFELNVSQTWRFTSLF